MAEALTGWTQGEMEGHPLGEVLRLGQEESAIPDEGLTAQIVRVGRSLDMLRGHAQLVRRDGSWRSVTYTAVPIKGRDSGLLGVVLVFGEPAGRPEAGSPLTHLETLESLAVVAGGIAHDLRNILTVAQAHLSLARLALDPLDSAQARLVGAERALQLAGDLGRQLLALASGDAPGPDQADLKTLLHEWANLGLAGSSIVLDFSAAEDLWPAEVGAGQISRVVLNLILNARQAMPQGGTIRVNAANATVRPSDGLALPPGPYVRIEVGDHGIGIPEDHLPRIFDPFYTTKGTGSGLGLAACLAIVRKHGGQITVRSEPGVGTTFTIYLPAMQGDPIAPSAPAGAHRRR